MKKVTLCLAVIAAISTLTSVVAYAATGKTVSARGASGTWYAYTEDLEVHSELACDTRSHATATGYNDGILWNCGKGDDVVLKRSGLTAKGEVAKASSGTHMFYLDKSWWDIYEY